MKRAAFAKCYVMQFIAGIAKAGYASFTSALASFFHLDLFGNGVGVVVDSGMKEKITIATLDHLK